ncbi:MAG TPA: response regulator [Stellaceae bacterium]|nr:response regulator [Stellaceae bacterium]
MIDPMETLHKANGTVLIIDDDPIAAQLYAAIIEATGYAVRIATPAAAYLKALAAEDAEPTAILLDIAMSEDGNPQDDSLDIMRALAGRQCRSPLFIMADGRSHYLEVVLELGRMWGLNLIDALPKPLDPDRLRRHMEMLHARNAGTTTGDRPRVVLLVDDDELVLLVATETLTRAGFEVRTAADGMEALDHLRQYGLVDLLFTDVDMPRMDGVALALAAQKLFPEIKILFTSGKIDHPPINKARFISKPWGIDELVAAAQSAIAL